MAAEAYEYVLGNVGVDAPMSGSVPETIVGEVLTGGAPPLIFGLIPDASRSGEGCSIVGSGFGASQVERSGVAEAFDGVDWQPLAVNGWSRTNASADAETTDRVIDPTFADIDPEHEVIDVVVPAWAEPPTMQIRVRTTV